MARIADVNVEEVDKYIAQVLESQRKTWALRYLIIFFTHADRRFFEAHDQCGAVSKRPG